MSASSNTQVEEEWRVIADCDEKYDVSNFGRVRSWADYHGGRRAAPLYKKHRVDRGYVSYLLFTQGKHKYHFAHRLVLAAFVGPSDLPVNHKNGVRDDNRLENLEYVTTKENVRHARDVLEREWGRKGEKHHNAKLSLEQVEQIRVLVNEGVTDTEVAARFGIKRQHVGRIRRGERWVSKGSVTELRQLSAKEGDVLIRALEKKLTEKVPA